MQQLGIFSPARERWIWHDSTAGYGGHTGLLSEVPTPISSGIPGNTQGAEAPPGRARLEALLIQVCRQKPRGLYPISLRPLVLHLQQKKKKRILWVLPRLTVGNDNSGCRAQAGGFHLIWVPDTEKLVGARDVADTLSTHWPESESGRRNNSWFRTSSIFLLVTCTHWIL